MESGRTRKAYTATTYNPNTTYNSIGDGTPTVASTALPGLWNRTAVTMHSNAFNSFNLSAVFIPSGSHSANCIGINYEDGIGNGALWGYDTFTEVTGIDSTFTITLEFKAPVS